MHVFHQPSLLLTLSLVVSPVLMMAQAPWLGLVPEVVHTEGDLAGMTTYRLYLYTLNESDFLVSCYGDDSSPLELSSTSEPAWFQHEAATTAFATDVNPLFFAAYPEFAYDSWLTIGAEDHTAAVDILSVEDPSYAAFAAFEQGESIEINGSIGCAWFVLPIPVNVEAIAGSDLRVLVAQLTTAGDISGQLYCLIFPEGISENEIRMELPIIIACNDPEATNYEPAAMNADGCVYADADGLDEVAVAHPLNMFPNPAKDMVTVSFPESLDATWIGAELQAKTLQGKLAGSWTIQEHVQQIDVSGMATGHYIMTVGAPTRTEPWFSGTLVVSK